MPEFRCETLEISGLPILRAASANQNVTNNIPREKPEERPPCLADTHKKNERVMDSEQNFDKNFWRTYSNGERYRLQQSSEANDIRFECWNETQAVRAFHRSRQYSTVVRSKAVFWTYTMEGESLEFSAESYIIWENGDKKRCYCIMKYNNLLSVSHRNQKTNFFPSN